MVRARAGIGFLIADTAVEAPHAEPTADLDRIQRSLKGGVGAMMTRAMKQGIVWGGVLILVGLLLLVNQFVELSPWVWVAFLAVAGLGAFGLWLADRSDGLMLLAAYVLWAIAGLIALVPSGILQDEAVALYVLPAIALPFLGVYIWDRAQWWALIPAYVLLAIGGVVILAEMGGFW